MTATIALTKDEAEAIARANAALAWIACGTFPWPADAREIRRHAASLEGSLRDYADLTAGRTHPATLFGDLADHRDNAMEAALDRVTEGIRQWTAALVTLADAAENTAQVREEGEAA